MQMSEVILFDLDGTITDSGEGIMNCVQYALGHFGINETSRKSLEAYVGPPLKEQFIKVNGFSEKQAEIAVSLYRERYVKTGIFENRVYDGIESVLRLLKSSGKRLGIASSKPGIFVNQVLDHFGLTQYFEVIVGSELDGTRSKKAEVIEYALELLGMQNDRANVLMVGDRAYDVKGALQCGIQCIGVAYGYGGIYELETAGAIYIAQTVEDLKVLAGSARSEAKKQNGKNQISKRAAHMGFWHKIWDAFYPVGIYFLIGLAVVVVASLIIMALNDAWYGYDLETLLVTEQSHQLLLLSIVAVVGIPIFLRMYLRDRKLRGIKNKVAVTTYVATAVLMLAASQAVNILIDLLKLNEKFPHYAENVSPQLVTEPTLIATILVVGVLTPVVEELVFRGLLFKRLQDYITTPVAIVVSALLFGAYHENMVQFIYATILGLLLAFVLSKTGSISVPIVGHIIANLWSIVVSRLIPIVVTMDVIAKYVVLVGLIVVSAVALIYIIRNKVQAKYASSR